MNRICEHYDLIWQALQSFTPDDPDAALKRFFFPRFSPPHFLCILLSLYRQKDALSTKCSRFGALLTLKRERLLVKTPNQFLIGVRKFYASATTRTRRTAAAAAENDAPADTAQSAEEDCAPTSDAEGATTAGADVTNSSSAVATAAAAAAAAASATAASSTPDESQVQPSQHPSLLTAIPATSTANSRGRKKRTHRGLMCM